MTVAELIEHLKTQPQHLRVAYDLHSEHCLLEPGYIRVMEACRPRADGWVPRRRDDMPTETYLMLPGN